MTEESFENVGRSTPRLSPPKKEAAGGPYRSTRFGFRVNRPATSGNKNISCDNVLNNNHSDDKINGKVNGCFKITFHSNESYFSSFFFK